MRQDARYFVTVSIALIALVLTLWVYAMVNRYFIISGAAGATAFRLDRWTGEVSFVNTLGVWPIRETN